MQLIQPIVDKHVLSLELDQLATLQDGSHLSSRVFEVPTYFPGPLYAHPPYEIDLHCNHWLKGLKDTG